MQFTRRNLLLTTALALILPHAAIAIPHGDSSVHGWHTLPLGCGGLVIGFDIAPDGTMVCRTDVGNVYRWSGTTANITDPAQKWVPLLTFASLGNSSTFATSNGGYELRIAPSQTNILYGIFGDNTGIAKWWVYRSTDAGATWAKTNLTLLNADSNGGPWKNAQQKIAIDPANPSVVYCGMTTGNGNTGGVFRAIDGVTFSDLGLGQATINPGSCGICFDVNSGTVTVGGQTRTKRVIVPLGGVGIFESTDGGVTFTETAVTPMGGSDVAVYQGYMDFDGVYYCIVLSNTSSRAGVWRYMSSTWLHIDTQTGWHQGVGWVTVGNLIVDPRSGHQGSVTISGPNGLGNGFTSTNANAAGASITWGGATGGQMPALTAPSYDVTWLNHGTQGLSAFLGGTQCIIDSSGVCWWSGSQGFWHFAAIPNYAVSTATTSVSVSRGMEATVSQVVLAAPGSPQPIMGTQDVGIMRGTLTAFPADYYVSGGRMDCETLDWAASDPSFIVSRVSVENQSPLGSSAYSLNYGATGSWVPYTNQADALYIGSATGSISDGSGGSGTVLVISAVASGSVLVGQHVFAGATSKGLITAQVSGTPFGVGTYTVDTASLTASTTLTFTQDSGTQAGACVAVDHDHHIIVPSGFNGHYQPAYTANATGACTWNFCTGLPVAQWTNRSFVFGANARPLAVDRVNIGTVYAAQPPGAGTVVNIYKSTDSGANWSQVGSITGLVANSGNYTSFYLISVPGNAGHLWFTGHFTGGSGAHLWRSVDGGANWTTVTVPGGGVMNDLTLGAPQVGGGYPTIIALTWTGFGGTPTLYYSTNQGSTWTILGPTGTQKDLPISCQLAGFASIHGDWNVFKRLYVGGGASGYAYYSP